MSPAPVSLLLISNQAARAGIQMTVSALAEHVRRRRDAAEHAECASC